MPIELRQGVDVRPAQLSPIPGCQLGDFVVIPALGEEVVLHVDDHQRGGGSLRHGPASLSSIEDTIQVSTKAYTPGRRMLTLLPPPPKVEGERTLPRRSVT